MTTINEALRAHVTSAQFTLVLGSTHIAALVQVDHHLRRNRSLREDLDERTIEDRRLTGADTPHHRAFRHNATGMNGLIRRGLVRHWMPKDGPEWQEQKPEEIWEITEAGRLVIGLLRESGLWAEFGGGDEV